ncbi:hypothetical protein BGZ82_003675, partial [Podila clonocystis]
MLRISIIAAIIALIICVSCEMVIPKYRPANTTEEAQYIMEGVLKAMKAARSEDVVGDDNIRSIIKVADTDFAGGSYPIVSYTAGDRTDTARLCAGDGISCSGGCIDRGKTITDEEDFIADHSLGMVGITFHKNPVCFDELTFVYGKKITSLAKLITFTGDLLAWCGAQTMLNGKID